MEAEFGPLTRRLAERYFEKVRFPAEAEAELKALHEKGFVVHVMRTRGWVNYLYLAWAMVRRGLPPVRAMVNVLPWFTRPWRLAAQSGDLRERFAYAKRHQGSALVFLKRSAIGTVSGRIPADDPFPALVHLARSGDGPVFLVPELFVWEKWLTALKPGLWDYVFGSPEAPGFLHGVVAFLRNYRRALFRVGEPIDLGAFIRQNPDGTDQVIARKVRGALHHHLARETRAVFGPPAKHTDRLIEETLRDRGLKAALEAEAARRGRPVAELTGKARRDLAAIAARPSTSLMALAVPVLSAIFHRIYDGIEVDEPGLDRAMKAAARAPIVLCPSHKSHVDYLVLSWVLWKRGYRMPLIAAGANLSFFPLGFIFRRGGAFFLRRSFKDDKVYAAAFKAYLRKLVHDGVHHEFFPEGGRSRTGKLLQPKLGMLTWEVEAVLDGARNDLFFVPVAIDYEKVVEGGAYTQELAGGEKQAEDLKGLLAARKVLWSRYGRIHLTFDVQVSVAELMASRQVTAATDDAGKKGLVRALGHRIMYGISRASTVTPQALLASALLAHRKRGISASELNTRVAFLKKWAQGAGAHLSHETDADAAEKALKGFVADGAVVVHQARGEAVYQVVEGRRTELSFSKNALMNLMAPATLVAASVLCAREGAPLADLKQRALFLSRLFKLEFVYRVGASFDVLFNEAADALASLGVLERGSSLKALDAPTLELLADLVRDFLESYLLAALTLSDVARSHGLERKAFVRAALENGRAEFLAGRIDAPEALSRPTLENAVSFLIEQRYLAEQDKKLVLGTVGVDPAAREALVADITRYVTR